MLNRLTERVFARSAAYQKSFPEFIPIVLDYGHLMLMGQKTAGKLQAAEVRWVRSWYARCQNKPCFE